MTVSTETKVSIGFGLALAILLAVGVIAYHATTDLLAASRWVTHTHQVLEQLSGTLNAVVQAETARRGFVLTNDRRFLDTLSLAVGEIDRSIEDLRRLTADNPQQQWRLNILEQLVRQKVRNIQQSVQWQEQHGPDPRVQQEMTEQGRELMDGIRLRLGQMQSEERALLLERNQRSEVSAGRTTFAIVLGTILAILIVIGAEVVIRQDIGARRRAEKKLANTLAWLNEVLSAATQVAIIATDTRGIITTFNSGAQKMLGYPHEEVVGKLTPLAFHLQDEAQAYGKEVSAKLGYTVEGFEAFVAYARRGAYDVREWTYVRKDGERLTVNLAVTAVTTLQGEIVGFLGVATDITERRRMDAELRESEERYRDLFENASDLIQSITPEGRIVYVNRAWRETLGYSEEEMRRLTIFDILDPVCRPHCVDVFQRVLAGEEVESVEAVFLARDGRKVDVEGSINCRFQDGKPVWTRGIFHDVTERNRAELALRDSEEQVRLLLGSTAEAIYGIDLQGNCTICNPACLRLLRYQGAWQLLGRNMHDLIHHTRKDGSPYPVAECRIFQAFREGVGVHVDNEVLWRADGTSFAAEYWSHPVLKAGKLVGAVVTFLDITERREIERMKNEFISVVSHELRTPLTSIRGALGLLAGGLLQAHPENSRKMLEIAVSNTDRLIRLINDILDIERLESGRVALEKKTCPVEELLASAAEAVRNVADKAGVRLEVLSASARIDADPDRVIQVLTNLLGNAIKFSPRGGTVWMSAAVRDEEVLFRVKDQGRGIPSDKLELIFERFQQVDASDRREKGGTGLGLAICRNIVQQHGGRIWVESVVGEGSTFLFTLPVRKEVAAKEEAPPRASAAAGRTTRILMAEDDDDLAGVMAATFERRGFSVARARTGRQAVQMAMSGRPDLLVLDLILPQGDGFSVVEDLRKSDALCNLPLVVYSVRDLDEPERERLKLGETLFLTKGRVSPEEVEQKAVGLLGSLRARRKEQRAG